MIIEGGAKLRGARIKSYLDHRIAMSFAVAGLAASGETVIEDSQCVDVSYPDFLLHWKVCINIRTNVQLQNSNAQIIVLSGFAVILLLILVSIVLNTKEKK